MYKSLIALTLANIGCGGASHGLHPSSAETRETADSAKAFVQDIFDHVGQNDFAYLKRSACPRAVVWDLDENGQPVAASGTAEINPFFDHYQELANHGAQVDTTVKNIVCRGGSDSAYCLTEFDQSIAMDGKNMGPYLFRATMVLHRHNGRWIWTHWHASMRAQTPPAAESQ